MDNNPATFDALFDIVERLRSPGGCPWDIEQTHASLKRNLLEECHEVLEAIDANDATKLSEELGDILVQVAFHVQMARESGKFRLQDVLDKANQKLIRRHPHVFGDVRVSDAHEVERNWEALKQREGGETFACGGHARRASGPCPRPANAGQGLEGGLRVGRRVGRTG